MNNLVNTLQIPQKKKMTSFSLFGIELKQQNNADSKRLMTCRLLGFQEVQSVWTAPILSICNNLLIC